MNMFVFVHHVQRGFALHHRDARRAFQRFGGHVAAAPQDFRFVFAHQQVTDAVGHDRRTTAQRSGELDLERFAVCGLDAFYFRGGRGAVSGRSDGRK